MVSLDYAEARYSRTRKTLTERAGFVPFSAALIAGLLAVVSYARSGPDSWSYSTDLVLRFATLVFPFALAAGPVLRLFLGPDDWRVGRWSRMMLLAFAGSYAVFILCVLTPYFETGARLPLATTGFAFFNVFILTVLALSASEHVASVMGDRMINGINRIAICYFWIAFAFVDVAHMYGPHRPDGFFGFSLSLLVVAVLIRFLDAFVLRVKDHLYSRNRLAGKVG